MKGGVRQSDNGAENKAKKVWLGCNKSYETIGRIEKITDLFYILYNVFPRAVKFNLENHTNCHAIFV